jgi:hypothetical protein
MIKFSGSLIFSSFTSAFAVLMSSLIEFEPVLDGIFSSVFVLQLADIERVDKINKEMIARSVCIGCLVLEIKDKQKQNVFN